MKAQTERVQPGHRPLIYLNLMTHFWSVDASNHLPWVIPAWGAIMTTPQVGLGTAAAAHYDHVVRLGSKCEVKDSAFRNLIGCWWGEAQVPDHTGGGRPYYGPSQMLPRTRPDARTEGHKRFGPFHCVSLMEETVRLVRIGLVPEPFVVVNAVDIGENLPPRPECGNRPTWCPR